MGTVPRCRGTVPAYRPTIPSRAGARRRGGRAARRRDARADARRAFRQPLRAHRRAGRLGDRRGLQGDQQGRRCREFVSRTREHLIDLMSRPLDDLRPTVVMLDGIDLKGAPSSRSGLTLAASSPRSGCGTARPRTPPSRPPCFRTSSSGSTASRACWSCSTAHERPGRSTTTTRALDQLPGLASELDRSHSARPRHCARASRRRSPSSALGCTAASSARSPGRVPASQ